MIKDGAEELAVPLTYLINSCLEQSVFPDTEKYAKIIPVYKSGKRSSMDNYRPISILPVLSKVFEKVVQKQLYEYLEKNSLLSPNQFAFRKHRSTQHPVTLLSDHIKGHMDSSIEKADCRTFVPFIIFNKTCPITKNTKNGFLLFGIFSTKIKKSIFGVLAELKLREKLVLTKTTKNGFFFLFGISSTK